jgi:hypothetical protein
MMTTRSPCVMLTATLTKGHLKIEQARPVAELFQQRPAEDQWSNRIMVQFLSPKQEILLRYPIEPQVLCGARSGQSPPGEADRLWVVGGVPLPTDAVRLEILSDGKSIAQQDIPTVGPELKFDWPFEQANQNGPATVKWSASHPQGAALQHSLCVVHEDGRWQPVAFTDGETEAEIDLPALPGGKIALGVESTDGFNIARAQTRAVERKLRNCTPLILSPGPEEKFLEGEEIVLEGFGFYDENGQREDEWLSWSSDRTGALGYLSPKAVRLPAGTHVISLKAGRPGREGQSSVRIVVGQAATGVLAAAKPAGSGKPRKPVPGKR